uniref:hypothetical protein n=1 Tax=Hafnia alvei TaxID=569 RepID=UPI0024300A0D
RELRAPAQRGSHRTPSIGLHMKAVIDRRSKPYTISHKGQAAETLHHTSTTNQTPKIAQQLPKALAIHRN